MKFIAEHVEGELFFELILRPLDLDLLENGKTLHRDVVFGKKTINIDVRYQKKDEKEDL